MASIQDVFKKCSCMMRLSICINVHVKKALINVLHNHIHDPQVKGLPSDPKDLYAFLQTNKRKIQSSKIIKEHEKSILLPTSSQTVVSSSFNIPLIRFLIRTFCGIRNARGGWGEPDSKDQTLCAYVYRAAYMWNAICRDDNIERLNATEFKRKWKQLKEILQGLMYDEDIEPFKTETLEFGRCEHVILEVTSVQEIFKNYIPWMRLPICIRIHVKKALINVLHNHINDPQVKGLPSDPGNLYAFLQTNKRKIQSSKIIKEHEKSILLPTSSQTVDLSSFNIPLIRFLIRTFCGIRNARGDWREPDSKDQTLCAYVYRAVYMWNAICRDDNIERWSATDFEKKWKQLKEILQGLKYDEDIEPFKTETLEFGRCEHVILEEYLKHLQTYKEKCFNEPSQDDYLLRRFSVDGNRNDIFTELHLETLIRDNDIVFIHGEAGIGKSSLAKRLRNEWCKGKVFDNYNIIYYDSKRIDKHCQIQSNAAALYFSELGFYFRKERTTIDHHSICSCVIDNLIIVIDGIDEFSVKVLTEDYLDRLERKIINNELITATETIIAIYFGFFFPYSKVILLGRIGEFERLKEFKGNGNEGIFNRSTIRLELLEFDKANIKDLTCLKICKHPSRQTVCTGSCQEIYNRIKNIELCKNPTDLNSLIELQRKHPNENVGRITRTKLIIATLLNRLNEHINRKNHFPSATFGNIRKQKDFSKYLEGIRTLGEISFKSLLKNNITVQVEEEQDNINGIVYFNYENQISIERETLEELDLFYVRDLVYYYILEPHHTINIEFLSACYLFSHTDGWNLSLQLNKDRQLEVINFIAGLHADDYFTKDFVLNVLNTPSYSLEQFLCWLYNIEDVRYSVPDGGTGYNCWYGLMENQKLSPSFYLLDYLSHEVEIPQNFIPKTIICYRGGHPFEWYYMEYFKHNFLTKLSDRLNMKSFLEKFPRFKFMIKSSIRIENNDEFHLLDRHSSNKLITFDIKDLYINASLNTSFTSYINANRLHIGRKCDSRTIDMILDAVTPPLANLSPSNIPRIKCKLLDIDDIPRLNHQQTEKLFKLGYMADSISLSKQLITDEQSAILKEIERKQINKQVDIQISRQRFNRISDLPELDSRHISLERVEDVNDDEWIKFRDHIVPVYSNNFSKYPIVDTDKPFGKKENHSRNFEQSMFLNIYEVNFRLVTPLVFADTFSLIPSISCEDVDQFIPSSHWSSLAQKEDSRINEMRIWFPQQENLKYFLNIKTNLMQFIYSCKDQLKQSLHLIINDKNIRLDKEIKVFVVKGDHDDQDYYEEVTSFSGKKLDEYKINFSLYDSQLDSICVPFNEREKYLKYWCCEISLPFHESTGFIGYHDVDESSLDEKNDESNSILVIDETENQGDGNCSESPLPSQESISFIEHFKNDESSLDETEDESNPIVLIDNAENQEGRNYSKIPTIMMMMMMMMKVLLMKQMMSQTQSF